MLSGVELCLVDSHVHEALSYNQIIGTDVTGDGCEINQDLHVESNEQTQQQWQPAQNSRDNPPPLFVMLRASGASSHWWLFYSIIIFRSAVHV